MNENGSISHTKRPTIGCSVFSILLFIPKDNHFVPFFDGDLVDKLVSSRVSMFFMNTICLSEPVFSSASQVVWFGYGSGKTS